jgi:carbon storage regulator
MLASGDSPGIGEAARGCGYPSVRGIGFHPASPLDRSSGHHGQQGGMGAMLVLTRKSNQSIMIGDDIEVSVLAIMGEKVRIGIQAPRDVPVFRREVYLEIQQESAGEGAREEVDAALQDLGGDS